MFVGFITEAIRIIIFSNDWNNCLFCSCITPVKLGYRQAALDVQKSNYLNGFCMIITTELTDLKTFDPKGFLRSSCSHKHVLTFFL